MSFRYPYIVRADISVYASNEDEAYELVQLALDVMADGASDHFTGATVTRVEENPA